MNKLMGFLELKEMNLPSIPWKQYTGHEIFDENTLWTIRSAVYRGNDWNLPRSIGKNAKESKQFADNLLKRMGSTGIVIYYPYFIARKSGTMEIRSNSAVIEAVNNDLWNLVTYSDCQVTIILQNGVAPKFLGNESFLCQDELNKLTKHIPEIRKIFRDNLLEGKAILLEWSFAFSCDIRKQPYGKEYLVFYEARTVD